MSTETVKKFYEAVSQDEVLKQKFAELSQKHQGEAVDEAKAMAVMEQEALPLAAQLGYSFTMDDLKAYGEELNQAKRNGELSDSELEAVTGGGMICVIGGGGDGGICVMAGVGQRGLCCIVGVIF